MMLRRAVLWMLRTRGWGLERWLFMGERVGMLTFEHQRQCNFAKQPSNIPYVLVIYHDIGTKVK